MVPWHENWAQIQERWLPVWVLRLAVLTLEFILSLDLTCKLRTLLWNDLIGCFYPYDSIVSFLVIHMKSGIDGLKNYYSSPDSKMTCEQVFFLYGNQQY